MTKVAKENQKSTEQSFTTHLLSCIVVHSIWGLQPAACRYLLVFSEQDFNSQSCIAFARLISITLMIAKDSFFADSEEAAVASTKAKWHLGPRDRYDDIDNPGSALDDGGRKFWPTMAVFGVLSAVRSMLNILSCAFTNAYNIAIVNLLSPVITPFADKVFLDATIPNIVWYAIAGTNIGEFSSYSFIHTDTRRPPIFHYCCINHFLANGIQSTRAIGCLCMIYGEWLTTRYDEYGAGRSHVIGVLLQLVSVLLSVCVRLMMKTTDGLCTKSQLMHAANSCTIVLGELTPARAQARSCERGREAAAATARSEDG